MKETDPLITKSTSQNQSWIRKTFLSGPTEFLNRLCDGFGTNLIIMLSVSQHLGKGLIGTFAHFPMQFIFSEYNVPAPRMQVFIGAIMLPWAMKPIVGLLSDAFPIFGYRKMGYILISDFISILAAIPLGFVPLGYLPIEFLVACLFLLRVQMATTDLLTEAQYAEFIKVKPELGPDLMSFVWGGIQVASLLATVVAPALMNVSLRVPYMLCLIPMILLIFPTWMNYLGEKKMTADDQVKSREKLYDQPEASLLCAFMFVGTVTLSALGIWYENVLANAIASLTLMIIMLILFQITFGGIVAKVNAFFLVQTSMAVSISGASFYFYTDTKEQYPDGPHFSIEFYTGVLGVVGTFCSLIGIMIYQRYLNNWSYRSLLIMANIILSVLSVLDVIFFLRWNIVHLGIPDHFFVLGASVSQSIVAQWMWMPGVVILSQLVDQGKEAMMYALLAGCHNLGHTVASNLGALLLLHLGISPKGIDCEQEEFHHLWIASLLSTLLPLLTCLMIPFFIPNVKQNEKFYVEHEDEAKMPWFRQWLRGRSRARRHVEIEKGSMYE